MTGARSEGAITTTGTLTTSVINRSATESTKRERAERINPADAHQMRSALIYRDIEVGPGPDGPLDPKLPFIGVVRWVNRSSTEEDSLTVVLWAALRRPGVSPLNYTLGHGVAASSNSLPVQRTGGIR